MGIETPVNYIDDLDPANPEGTDIVGQCDNHIRLIKEAILGTFPFMAEAVVPTVGEMTRWMDLVVTDGTSVYLTGPEYVDDPVADKDYYLRLDADGKLERTEQFGIPVGFVVQSVLTQAQMDAVEGPQIFVLCNGSTYLGSKYEALFGTAVVPTMENEDYTRPAKSNFGGRIESSTSSKGWELEVVKDTHEHNLFHLHNHMLGEQRGRTDSGGIQIWHMDMIGDPVTTQNQTGYDSVGDYYEQTIPDTHKHTIPDLESTATQTRPNSILFNHFIRIN